MSSSSPRVLALGLGLLPVLLACSAEGTSTTEGPTGGSGGAGGATATTATTSSAGGGGAAATGVGGAGGAGGSGGAEEPPPFDSIPWETGDDVGFGIARKDTQNPEGSSVFIGYGGFGSTLAAAEAWTGALYGASLKDLGVRTVYAVQGPADVGYLGLEIGNSKLAAALPAALTDPAAFVLIAAHSSGTFVAHELLGQLQSGLDPTDATADRVVYFNLDGGSSGLTPAIVDRLRKAYFVAAVDGGTGTTSPNWNTMVSLGATYGAKGGYWELDASAAGCVFGGTWCLHMAPITTLPHDPTQATIPADYEDFVGRPVATAYIEAKAAEAGL